jgi:hypothetical protein
MGLLKLIECVSDHITVDISVQLIAQALGDFGNGPLSVTVIPDNCRCAIEAVRAVPLQVVDEHLIR